MKLRHVQEDTAMLNHAVHVLADRDKAHNIDTENWCGMEFVWDETGFAVLTGKQLKNALKRTDSANHLSTYHEPKDPSKRDRFFKGMTDDTEKKIFNYIDNHKGLLFSVSASYFDYNYRIAPDTVKILTKKRFDKYVVALQMELENTYSELEDLDMASEKDTALLDTSSDLNMAKD